MNSETSELTVAFIGGLGPVELGLLLIPLILILLGLFGRWIYRDAKARGSEWAVQWAIGIPFLFTLGAVPGLLALIVYLLKRQDVSSPGEKGPHGAV